MFSVMSQVHRAKLTKRAREYSIHGLLCFLLVFVQAAGLAHSHEGELQKQFDCGICLKANSNDDAIADSGQSLDFSNNSVTYKEPSERILFIASVPANSRAPPLA